MVILLKVFTYKKIPKQYEYFDNRFQWTIGK
jgi:hypothetical protein